MQKRISFFLIIFLLCFQHMLSEPIPYYYDDLSAIVRIYDDSSYVDRTLFSACHGADTNYYVSRDIFSKECENISRLSTSLISYNPESSFLPSIRISTDIVSLIRFALSMIGCIHFDSDTIHSDHISQYEFSNSSAPIQFE